ncbi:RpL19 [Nucleospora cyclopteri]
MRKLASVKRMAKNVLNCGRNKLWIDPNEYEKVLAVDTIQGVQELIEEGSISKRPDKINSKAKARKRAEAKRKGRHMGFGSRKGTKNARLPAKTIWIKTIRSMRTVLKEMKVNGELNSEEYHKYRQQAKGNMFKLNKNTMVDHINKKKAEAQRLAELERQAAALKMGEN